MNKRMAKRIVRDIAWSKKSKTISQVLQSRCRKDGAPEYGRFTSKEIKDIISLTGRNIKELMPTFIDQDNIGNYQNEFVGLIDLAIYRALKAADIDAIYAIKLAADMMWQAVVNSKGLVPIIDPLRKKIMRFYIKEPFRILEKRLREMMKYPYGSPGYDIDFHEDNGVFCMNIFTCPVYDFFKQFGSEEMEFFRRTWCTFDYTAAENVVEGGKYEREHTLSDGDDVCDMRWYIKEGR